MSYNVNLKDILKALTHENSLMNHIRAKTFTVMMLVMFSLRE